MPSIEASAAVRSLASVRGVLIPGNRAWYQSASLSLCLIPGIYRPTNDRSSRRHSIAGQTLTVKYHRKGWGSSPGLPF